MPPARSGHETSHLRETARKAAQCKTGACALQSGRAAEVPWSGHGLRILSASTLTPVGLRGREITVAFDTERYLRTTGRLSDVNRRIEATGSRIARHERDERIASTYEFWAEAARWIGAARGYTITPLNSNESHKSTHTQTSRGRSVEQEIHKAAVGHLEFREQVAAALAQELGAAADAIGGLVGKTERWQWEQAVQAQAPLIASQLCQLDDDPSTRRAAADVMRVLWPRCSPEEAGRPDWWRSLLGLVCARPISQTDTRTVSHTAAAAILGVPRNHIGQMVKRGQLDRHPDDARVQRSSVLRRLDWKPWPTTTRRRPPK